MAGGNIWTMLKFTLENKVTDLFISAGKVPSCRSGGEVLQVEFSVITAEEMNEFRQSLIGEEGEKKYQATGGFDAPYTFDELNRFRLNFFESVNGPCVVARPIRLGGSLDFDKLGLAKKIQDLALLERGLVLVTGTTGSGKSTTLSAMINHINCTCHKHILTLEDPIEFMHHDKMSLISQREVDSIDAGFTEALKNALRESPNVIMIGEMRDMETMQIAIAAAQTGHLVFSTLHTANTVSTVRRLLNMCPEGSREQMAFNLAQVLEAVISQRLLPRQDGSGMVPAQEILLATPTVKKQIERNDIRGMELSLEVGSMEGMQTFNGAIYKLLTDGVISEEVALRASDNPEALKLMCQHIGNFESDIKEQERRSNWAADLTMRDIFKVAVDAGASDFLLTVNSPPVLCCNGSFQAQDLPELRLEDVQRLIYSVISKEQRVRFEETKELDFAMGVNLDGDDTNHRFRLNAFFQRGTPAMVGRRLSNRIPSVSELNLPPILSKLMTRKQGLILVTGATGSGKSTTLASLLDEVNQTAPKHIVTIEDPVEYVYENKCSFIEQRELGKDTLSFASGLRAALRQAPNIIFVGELRDTETISVAIAAAETGHLVISTLHANDTTQTVERIVDSFPVAQQNQIRLQFSEVITGVVAQRLLPRADGNGRIAAFEIMVGTAPVRALIREGKSFQLASTLQTSTKDGMCTLQSSLDELLAAGTITQADHDAYMPHIGK